MVRGYITFFIVALILFLCIRLLHSLPQSAYLSPSNLEYMSLLYLLSACTLHGNCLIHLDAIMSQVPKLAAETQSFS